LNACWREIRARVPFYKRLVEEGAAPTRFDSWDQYLAALPVVDKSMVYRNYSELADPSRRPDYQRITGGSTASPVQLPAWNSEVSVTEPDMWMGRGWYNIDPGDRMFMIWGHRHLLGKGFQGWKNAKMRQIKDRLLGYTRFPAYDLSLEAMRRARHALQESGAAYAIGYSVALDRFARANEDAPIPLSPRLKAVIGTAESFPFADSSSLVGRVFQAPVAMEYGAVETGLIAHTVPEGGFRAFWLTYFLEAMERGTSGGYKLRVTSLYPRCFPLLRYDIGDEIELPAPAIGVASFSRVIGRCNDYIEFDDGLMIHSEAITHSLSGVSALSGYQMVREGKRLILRLTLRGALDDAEKAGILERLAKIHPTLGDTEFEVVKALEQTTAGKTPMVIRH
jgi:phenylacetate-coenzyme A ligase PaaK-like adenylate-forming protein